MLLGLVFRSLRGLGQGSRFGRGQRSCARFNNQDKVLGVHATKIISTYSDLNINFRS